MEEDPTILKIEYLSNHGSDFPQILNFSLGDQTKIKNTQNEDDFQWKTASKYSNLNMSAAWSDFPQIWDLSSGDQTKIKNAWYEDDLQ